MATFGIQGNEFVYEGKPVRLLSGAIHYFRVVPQYWEDRLLKLKACGLNTVETYVPWNLHEPEKGRFDFEGLCDLEGFVTLAGKLGLHVLLRPSPYICAEWEFGGLPAWLLADDGIALRCDDSRYLRHVDDYYDELLPRIRPLLCTNGGPVIAVQVENEYGSYGNDKAYLRHIRESLEKGGIDTLLFTSDGPEDHMLQGGMSEGVFATVNFGSDAPGAFAKLREYQPEGPLMCMEFWNGWFDHWMEEHQTRPAEDVAAVFEDMLKAGASVNFYMFHGGTNFGFMNGANHIKQYEPTVNSYDYDTLLNESGEPTAKFYAVRGALERYMELPPLELPEPIAKKAYGRVELTQTADLLEQALRLSPPVKKTNPEPMEKLGQSYGYTLYTTYLKGPRAGASLHIQEVRDRAQVFADGAYIGTTQRWNPEALPLDVPPGGLRIDILVENMGRVNYGPYLRDSKGITEGVRLDNQFLYHWEISTLPMDSLEGLEFEAAPSEYSGPCSGQSGNESVPGFRAESTAASCAESAVDPTAASASGPRTESTGELRRGASDAGRPTFYRGEFQVEEEADTFLRLDGWIKGHVTLNGFNLGRYWKEGPTRTLYVPAPLLRKGSNVLIVFELHGTESPSVEFTDKPELG